MEFLMTYGWAILIVVIAVAALAAFGVFNPQRFAQERCVGDSTKFACSSNAISINDSTGTVQFELTNAAGSTVNITSVSTTSDGSCTLSSYSLLDPSNSSNVLTNQAIAANQNFILEAVCGQQAPKGVFQDTFTVHYGIVGGVQNLKGDIQVVVKT